ncbi:MAG: hypothetical protein V3V78_02855 [Candidatus Woesearchaeota archaeon]
MVEYIEDVVAALFYAKEAIHAKQEIRTNHEPPLDEWADVVYFLDKYQNFDTVIKLKCKFDKEFGLKNNSNNYVGKSLLPEEFEQYPKTELNLKDEKLVARVNTELEWAIYLFNTSKVVEKYDVLSGTIKLAVVNCLKTSVNKFSSAQAQQYWKDLRETFVKKAS